jgi:hypothetical protein
VEIAAVEQCDAGSGRDKRNGDQEEEVRRGYSLAERVADGVVIERRHFLQRLESAHEHGERVDEV